MMKQLRSIKNQEFYDFPIQKLRLTNICLIAYGHLKRIFFFLVWRKGKRGKRCGLLRCFTFGSHWWLVSFPKQKPCIIFCIFVRIVVVTRTPSLYWLANCLFWGELDENVSLLSLSIHWFITDCEMLSCYLRAFEEKLFPNLNIDDFRFFSWCRH